MVRFLCNTCYYFKAHDFFATENSGKIDETCAVVMQIFNKHLIEPKNTLFSSIKHFKRVKLENECKWRLIPITFAYLNIFVTVYERAGGIFVELLSSKGKHNKL